MQSLFISEMPPVMLGGRTQSADVGHAQNANVVRFNDREFIYMKRLRLLPETFEPPFVDLRYADTDGLQDNGSLRRMFTGRNSINNGGNPVISATASGWSEGLNSYAASRKAATIAASAMVAGERYEVVTTGTSDFTAQGADSNVAGCAFTTTGAGTGTGTVAESLRWADTSEATIQSDAALADRFYVVAAANGEDLTAIGAPSSDAGVIFQATGAGTGAADLYLTAGGRWGDIAACAATEGATTYVQMYVNVYDAADENDNRLFLLESTDGVSFADQGEITYSGGNFGATVADVVQVGSVLYMICGENAGVGRGYQKRLRYSNDRGRTWTEVGTILPLSSDSAAPHYYGLPVGRFLPYTDGDTYLRFSAPASRISGDQPECNLMIRRAVASLQDSGNWDIYRNGPAAMRGPQMATLHNVNFLSAMQDGTQFGVTNEFGALSYDDVNTADMNTLRESPYYKQDVFSFKHTGALRTVNRLAVEDWDWWPFADGDTVYLTHNGLYLGSGTTFGSNTYLTTDRADPNVQWVAEKQGAVFWMFKQAAATAVSLSTGGSGAYASRRAIGLPIEVRTHDAATAANNIEHHWGVFPHGGNSPSVCTLVNRESGLALAGDCAQRPALWGRADQLFNIEVVS